MCISYLNKSITPYTTYSRCVNVISYTVHRLKSEKPPHEIGPKTNLGNINTEWNNERKTSDPDKLKLIEHPTEQKPAFDLSKPD